MAMMQAAKQRMSKKFRDGETEDGDDYIRVVILSENTIQFELVKTNGTNTIERKYIHITPNAARQMARWMLVAIPPHLDKSADVEPNDVS